MLATLRDQKRWRTKLSQDGDYYIQGKRGRISLRKNGSLDVWITNRRSAIKAEQHWPVKCHYDDGCLIIRPVDDLDQSARIIKAPKRRQVTEAMRESGRQLAARLRRNEAKARIKAPLASLILEKAGTDVPPKLGPGNPLLTQSPMESKATG